MQTANLQGDVTALEQNRRLVVRIRSAISTPKSEVIHAATLSLWEEHPNVEAVFLDMSQVPQIDSSGVGFLMELASRTERAGVPLSICGLQDAPRRLLNRTHLDGLFHIYPTVEEALLDVAPGADSSPRLMPSPRPMLEAVRLPPPPGKKRGPQQSRKLIWGVMTVILLALIAAGTYAFMAIGAYRGRMRVLTAMQDNLISTGRRIDAAENALRAPTAQEAGTGSLAPPTELEIRIATLQNEVDNLQAAQQAAYAQIASLQEQVRQLQARAGGEE